MAEKLVMYYKFVGDIKGLAGRMALAQATKIPSVKAALQPDSPENIQTFRLAAKQITGQEPPLF